MKSFNCPDCAFRNADNDKDLDPCTACYRNSSYINKTNQINEVPPYSLFNYEPYLPECCRSCGNYKKGVICHCTLPYMTTSGITGNTTYDNCSTIGINNTTNTTGFTTLDNKTNL